jgi:hypothetical protein
LLTRRNVSDRNLIINEEFLLTPSRRRSCSKLQIAAYSKRASYF